MKQLFLNDSQAASKASSSLEVMANITTKTVESSDAGMGQLNIITAVDILERFVRLNEMHNNTVIVSAKDQQNFVNIASSLLSPSNNKNWQGNPEVNKTCFLTWENTNTAPELLLPLEILSIFSEQFWRAYVCIF